ncbi:MAG TPA: putative DNA-binding domain-containing protein [Pseudobdellovibrionaceae bacterium]|jgi:hypothetical protein|nr:putative DNA-binding domain-containing protein [Pseudobdellovibrionaceae bacterium]
MQKNNLNLTQKYLIKNLLDPQNKSKDLLSKFNGTSQQIKTGMDVYKNAYRLRLIESITSDFQYSIKALGVRKFNSLCLTYIYNQPSEFHDLLDYSHQFPEFLKKNKKLILKTPWIISLLLFERALNLISLGSSKSNSKSNSILETSQIQLKSSAQLLTSTYDLNKAISHQRIKALPKIKTYYRISKSGSKIYFPKISKAEYLILKKLESKHSISELSHSISSKTLNHLSGWFSDWIKEGVIEIVSDPRI